MDDVLSKPLSVPALTAMIKNSGMRRKRRRMRHL
jgi:hypothetical protein